MERRLLIRRLLVVFLLTALGVAGYYTWSAPTTLRIAVGPDGTEQARFVVALAKALRESREPFRLEPVVVAGSAEASLALDGKAAELAVLRSDDPTSGEAQSLAILHRRAMIIISRSDRVKKFADLRGKRVLSVQGSTDSNKAVILRILSHLGLDADAFALQESTLADAATALASGKTDALILIAPPTGAKLRELIAALVKERVPLSFIAPPSAEALASRFPYLATTKIPAGIFGGMPAQPKEPLDTVEITHELVASRALSGRTVSALLKAIEGVPLKPKNADGAPFGIELPPTDETRRFAVHAGAKAYIEDDVKTLLDTYSDQIWLALFALSLIGSSVTGLMVWMGFQKAPAGAAIATKISNLVEAILAAKALPDLEMIQHELDKVVALALRDIPSGTSDEVPSDLFERLNQAQSLLDHARDRLRQESNDDGDGAILDKSASRVPPDNE